MVQHHSRTAHDYAQWVSTVVAPSGSYGLLSALSQQLGVARQTLSRWKAKGLASLEATFTPPPQGAAAACPLERAMVTLLVEGHASSRGIQQCLWTLLGQQVSLGKIAAVVQSAGQLAQDWIARHAPDTPRALAVDELYGSQRGEGDLNVVDVPSGAVWASTSPVAVDAESWILLLWPVQEQGLHWQTTISDGGRAIGEAVATVAPEQADHRAGWHSLSA